MAVKLRLQRRGRKRQPFYHIVAADARAPRDGRFIERVGWYNPNKNPAIAHIDHDKALKWLKHGAIPTDTVRNIFSKTGVLYKKHLLRGVAKGALTEEQATQQFEEWLEKRRKAKNPKIMLEVWRKPVNATTTIETITTPQPEPETATTESLTGSQQNTGTVDTPPIIPNPNPPAPDM